MTPKQKQLLDYIRQYIAEHDGIAPSVREMVKGIGGSSTSHVHAILERLEEGGYIIRQKSRARRIFIPKQGHARFNETDCLEFINSKNLRKEFFAFIENRDLHRGQV